jgi:hypothetical protein
LPAQAVGSCDLLIAAVLFLLLPKTTMITFVRHLQSGAFFTFVYYISLFDEVQVYFYELQEVDETNRNRYNISNREWYGCDIV